MNQQFNDKRVNPHYYEVSETTNEGVDFYMNMKDAFRFQNKLQTLMGTAQDILSSSRNITKVENTYLRAEGV